MAEKAPDSKAEHDAVYRAAGYALEQAQYFEAEVVNIVLLHGRARRRVVSRAQAEELIAGSQRAPLRKLLKEVLARLRTEPDLTETFFEAVDRRNWLVHRFFWDRADEFKTTSGRSEILSEIREATALFHSAHVFAQMISELYLVQTGVDPDELHERLRGS